MNKWLRIRNHFKKGIQQVSHNLNIEYKILEDKSIKKYKRLFNFIITHE